MGACGDLCVEGWCTPIHARRHMYKYTHRHVNNPWTNILVVPSLMLQVNAGFNTVNMAVNHIAAATTAAIPSQIAIPMGRNIDKDAQTREGEHSNHVKKSNAAAPGVSPRFLAVMSRNVNHSCDVLCYYPLLTFRQDRVDGGHPGGPPRGCSCSAGMRCGRVQGRHQGQHGAAHGGVAGEDRGACCGWRCVLWFSWAGRRREQPWRGISLVLGEGRCDWMVMALTRHPETRKSSANCTLDANGSQNFKESFTTPHCRTSAPALPAKQGDVPGVKLLLDHADKVEAPDLPESRRLVNTVNLTGLTPCHFAAWRGHGSVVRELINAGAYLAVRGG